MLFSQGCEMIPRNQAVKQSPVACLYYSKISHLYKLMIETLLPLALSLALLGKAAKIK